MWPHLAFVLVMMVPRPRRRIPELLHHVRPRELAQLGKEYGLRVCAFALVHLCACVHLYAYVLSVCACALVYKRTHLREGSLCE